MFPRLERPERLSNRGCCFSDEELAAISRKPVAELDWSDYEAIFTLSQCTAEYGQQLYYLPFALEYVRQNPDEGNEILPSLANFLARAKLRGDGVFESGIAAFRAMFEDWTQTFTINGSLVQNSPAVCEWIDAAIRHGLEPLAVELLQSWRSSTRPEDAAWLLEFAKEEPRRRSRFGIDDTLLQMEYNRIKDTPLVRDQAFDYWRELVEELGLRA